MGKIDGELTNAHMKWSVESYFSVNDVNLQWIQSFCSNTSEYLPAIYS